MSESEGATITARTFADDAQEEAVSGACPLCAAPLPLERIRETLLRARALIDVGMRRAAEHTLREAGEESPRVEFFVVRRSGHHTFVRVDSIDWIEASRNRVRLHVGSEVHELCATMGSIEARLDSKRFWRIHRSTIVNVERVREMRSAGNGRCRLTLADGTELTMSETYRRLWKEFQKTTG
jgi:two-component system LytT family response regulator